jgi:hypothetical protein
MDISLFLTDNIRAKAHLKYELRKLEYKLEQRVEAFEQAKSCPDEIKELCGLLLSKYLHYLQLIKVPLPENFLYSIKEGKNASWLDDCHLLLHLKKQLIQTSLIDEQKNLLLTIASLCYQVKESSAQEDSEVVIGDITSPLFASDSLRLWLFELLKFWNQSQSQELDAISLVRQWSLSQQQHALGLFSAPEHVQFINALFFYKLYPEHLFDGPLHPEKLISLRIKLGLLHRHIEIIQQELYKLAAEEPIDFLLHNEELPPGINLSPNQQHKCLIQEAVKELKVLPNKNIGRVNSMDWTYDLLAAYKFCFNPNRLIDTVMLLREVEKKYLEQKLAGLYQQLSTTECVDLYGYFSNKDTKYLLQALQRAIEAPWSLKWLSSITSQQKNTIQELFLTIKSVMEAVRVELNNRCISTAPYLYEMDLETSEIGMCNRSAILRVLELYSFKEEVINPNLEQLFKEVKNLHNSMIDTDNI